MEPETGRPKSRLMVAIHAKWSPQLTQRARVRRTARARVSPKKKETSTEAVVVGAAWVRQMA